MDIATGYFAKARQYADDGYALVSIAKVAPWFIPKELTMYSLSCLAPTDEILGLKDNPREYEKKYKEEILGHLSLIEIYESLLRIASKSKSDKVVLLCYESPEKFCHRHLVAKWIEDGLWKVVSEISPKQQQNQSLFDSDV